MTEQQLLMAFPNASKSFIQANATKTNSPIQNPISKQNYAPALGSAIQRKKDGLGLAVGRIEVRFTLFRVRCLDPDNAAASTKNLLDGLRHSGLLSEDNPWTIRLQVEQNYAPALGSAIQRKKDGLGLAVGRIEVRFTLFRVRCLDPDNAAASTKNLLDGLRHSGLLSEDNPWTIRLQVEQEKVKSFDQEKTEIEINYPIDYWEVIK
jgi:Holliday junction resolvase RusA-like endonuclease